MSGVRAFLRAPVMWPVVAVLSALFTALATTALCIYAADEADR